MPYRTPRESREDGRGARSAVPRSSHGSWTPPESRADPVATLRAGEGQRVSELLGLRYERMAESPFGFLRGSAAVMAADLASTPRAGPRVQACGDAHIGNFRLLGTPERTLVLDLNDFDETAPAPFEWDLKRLAASAVVAARQDGLATNSCRQIAEKAVRSYRTRMAGFARQRALDVWYSRVDQAMLEEVIAQSKIDVRQHRRARRLMERASEKDNLRAVRRLTTRVDGKLRFRDDPPVLYHSPIGEEVVEQALRAYRVSLPNHTRALLDRYQLVDYAFKVVGVGSVGTRCWIALFDRQDANDSIVLQLKQAGPSVLEPFAGRSAYGHGGRRVVEGQRLIQAYGDMFLGWTRNQSEGVDFYVRQLWDMKGKLNLQLMNEESLSLFAELSGWTLARAHARSGDPAAIAGYMGTGRSFDRALGSFAVAYADQTERDHERLCTALEKGEIGG